MNKIQRRFLTIAISCLFGASMQSATAASKGGSPNGKPFAEINGQIVEIQNDITSLQTEMDNFKADVDARFDSVEGKVTAIDLKIKDLELKDQELVGQMQAIINSVANNNEAIGAILTTINDLNTQIAALQTDIEELEESSNLNLDLIRANEETIELLRADVVAGYDQLAGEVEGVASILAQKLDIEEFVTQLNQYKSDVQQQFDMKQDIINAGCSDGEFISNLQADGSFDCNAPAALANGVTRTTRYSSWVTVPHAFYGRTGSYQRAYSCGFLGLETCYETVPTYGYIYPLKTAFISCRPGHLRASMSYEIVQPTNSYISGSVQAYGTEGASATGKNTSYSSDGSIRAVVTCFGVNP